MSFSSVKETKNIHRVFVVLSGWADASTLSMKEFRQFKPPFAFSIECCIELFCFIQQTLLGEEALRAEETRTL